MPYSSNTEIDHSLAEMDYSLDRNGCDNSSRIRNSVLRSYHVISVMVPLIKYHDSIRNNFISSGI